MDRLHGEVLYQDEQLCVCKDEAELQVLMINPSYIHPMMSIHARYLQYQALEIVLTLQQLPPTRYLFKTYSLDKDHGGIYNDWLRLGGLAELDAETLAYFQKKIMLQFEAAVEERQEDLHLRETLSFNACRLITFKPLLLD